MSGRPKMFAVWIKGQRAGSVRYVEASLKITALIKFAAERGLKSYQCDARLMR